MPAYELPNCILHARDLGTLSIFSDSRTSSCQAPCPWFDESMVYFLFLQEQLKDIIIIKEDQ
jgi:hypothetical protein